jgi:hypothetical protein
MPRTIEAPHVHVVTGQQYLDGEPTDIIVNAAEHEVTVTDPGDADGLQRRLVLAGMAYQREISRPPRLRFTDPPVIGDGVSLVAWPPPHFAQFIPTVPVRGHASAAPLSE